MSRFVIGINMLFLTSTEVHKINFSLKKSLRVILLMLFPQLNFLIHFFLLFIYMFHHFVKYILIIYVFIVSWTRINVLSDIGLMFNVILYDV